MDESRGLWEGDCSDCRESVSRWFEKGREEKKEKVTKVKERDVREEISWGWDWNKISSIGNVEKKIICKIDGAYGNQQYKRFWKTSLKVRN